MNYLEGKIEPLNIFISWEMYGYRKVIRYESKMLSLSFLPVERKYSPHPSPPCKLGKLNRFG